ncbi:hypothetical protein B0J17DRAFT_631365 [Rhizoctonia solani]|nr:hypothetical protein B0J17DRAFT_631365 [Rhizoctonia solani]
MAKLGNNQVVGEAQGCGLANDLFMPNYLVVWLQMFLGCGDGRNQQEELRACIGSGETLMCIYSECFKVFITPSRASMDALQDDILDTIEQAYTSYSEQKTRAHVQDNYCCQMTGVIDVILFLSSPELQAKVNGNITLLLKPTECSHIIPQYISTAMKCINSTTIWSVIDAFGGIPQNKINEDSIHHLQNIMTLQKSIHFSFNCLWIWLEPVEVSQEHIYTLGQRAAAIHGELSPTVSFTGNSGLPLTGWQYLVLHTTCTKVLDLSGACHDLTCWQQLRQTGQLNH